MDKIMCVVCGEDEALTGDNRPGVLCFVCETVAPFDNMGSASEIRAVATDREFCELAMAYHRGDIRGKQDSNR